MSCHRLQYQQKLKLEWLLNGNELKKFFIFPNSSNHSINDVDTSEEKQLLSGNPGQLFGDDHNDKVYYSDAPQQERTRQVPLEWTKKQNNSFDDHLIIKPNLSQNALLGLQNARLSAQNNSRDINDLNKDDSNNSRLNYRNMGPSFHGAQSISTNAESYLDSNSQATPSNKFTPKRKKSEGPENGNNSVIKKGGVQAKLFLKSPGNTSSTRFRNDKRFEQPKQPTFSHQSQWQQQGYKMHHQNRDVFYDDPPKEHQQQILTTPQPLFSNGFPIRFYIFYVNKHQSLHNHIY